MKLLVLLLVFGVSKRTLSSNDVRSADNEKESERTSKGLYTDTKMNDNRNVFSPRMDYDEWTPLGRGDPLKNDPTYDYVPPVLERVHYWMDPSKRTPDPPVVNSGVLILGSSRTEPSFTLRLTTPKYQAVPMKETQADSRLDTMSLLDPFLKLMDVSKFGINLNPSTNAYYYKPSSNSNRIHQYNFQRPTYQQQYSSQRYQQPQALQRPPYTMLMPPPPPSPTSLTFTTFATITTTTEVPKTHSVPTTTTNAEASQPSTTGTTPASSTTTVIAKSTQETNITTIYPTTIFANTENVYKPVAIAMPEENETIRNDTENFSEKAEFKKKNVTKLQDDSMIPTIVSAPNGVRQRPENTCEEEKEHNIVHQSTKRPPSSYLQQHKRPQQEHQANNGNMLRSKEPYKYGSLYETKDPQNLQDNSLKQPHRGMTQPPKGTKVEKYQSSNKWGTGNRATTMRPVTSTTATNMLTTDPMFKHYKQPSEPIKGPFYLIIQGHSKVKTYGASKNPINGLLTSNEIKEYAEDKKDHYNELYDLEPRNVRRKNGKSLTWHPSAGYENQLRDDRDKRLDEIDETIAGNDPKTPALSELSVFDVVDGKGHLGHLEDAFGKSEGGTSKKRYLVNYAMNDTDETYAYDVPARSSRQLLGLREVAASIPSSGQMITVANRPTTSSHPGKDTQSIDNFDIESFIALNDDYSPEDVVGLLLKDEGQGSGLGNLVVSVFGKSLKEDGEDNRY